MQISNEHADPTVRRELGERLRRLRLDRNLDQRQLAEESGIGRATLQRLEEGEPVNLTTWLRVLRTLGLLEGLNQLIPEPGPSPLQELELQGRRRQRASSVRRAGVVDDEVGDWHWGDEKQNGQ